LTMYLRSGCRSKSMGGSSSTEVLVSEHLAQVRMANQRQRSQLLENGQALTCLLGREDVLELFEPHRRAVTQVHRLLGQLDLVRQLLEPRHVLGGQELRV